MKPSLTQRERTEEILRVSEDRYRALVTCSLDAVLLTAPNGDILTANPAACRMFGYSEQELIQAGRGGVVDGSDPRLAGAIEERAHTGRFQGELTFVRKDGTKFPGEISSSTFVDAQGEPRTSMVIRDITERRQAEEVLQDSEERYRRLFEVETDAILLVDRETGRFMDANPAALRLYGYSRQEFLLLRTCDVSAEPDRTSPSMPGGETFVALRHHRKKDGTVFPVEITGNYFEFQGRKVQVAAIRDITERQQLEADRELTIDLLNLINSTADFRELMRKATLLLRDATGCEAIGIRVRDGEDFPYFETAGFSATFVEAENSLCATDAQGEPLRDQQGNPVLECMCGNILCGRFDATKPFFTARGSFWTNSTTALLASTTAADRQARTRSRCQGQGYESVALVRMRTGGETFGLLQFNDPRPGRFTPDKIARLERVADHLASAAAHWQAQQARRRSDEALRLAAEAAGFGTYAYAFASGTGHWSPEFKALLGLKPDEPLLLDADKVPVCLHPDDRPAFLAAMTAANDPRGNGLLQLDYRIFRPDRSVRWLQVRGLTSFVGEGLHRRPDRAAGIVTDITPRRQMEESVAQLLKEHRAILGAAPIGIALSKGRSVQWTNLVYQGMLGYSPEELRGRDTSVLYVHIEDYERVGREGLVQIAQGLTYATEVEFKRKDGRCFWCLLQGRAIDPRDLSIGVIWMLKDVTERKRGETALRESEDRFRAIFNESPLGIALVDLEGRPFLTNLACQRMMGRTSEELSQMVFTAFTYPEDRDKDMSLFRQLTAGERDDYQIEKRYFRKDGQLVWASLTVTLIREPTGQPKVALSIVEDITARKRSEADLRASREQLRALAARVEAVREDERTRVAREIHDVLAQELTNLKIDVALLNRLLPPAPGEAESSLVCQKLAEMAAMTDTAIQSVQKIATDLRPAVLDSLGLCAAIEWQVNEFAKRTGIRCQAHLPAKDLALDRERSTAVFRILQESLTNVARHAAATRVEVHLQSGAERITLVVQDDGRGITAEQANASGAVGLLGMRERALALGGRCEIAGRPGQGTKVEARLPFPPGVESKVQ